MDQNIKKFIENCAKTFRLMDHEVTPGKPESAWHFQSTNNRGDRSYAIFCTPTITSCKALIQASIRQARTEGARFVVVALSMANGDLDHSEKLDYCLVTLNEIEKYGDEMLEIRDGTQIDEHGRVILKH